MGMQKFDHIAAKSLDDAVTQLGKFRKSAVVVAGGTDILGILKDEVHPVYPKVVLDLKTIEGLEYIREEGGGLKVGALTTLTTIQKNETVRGKYGLLAEAAHAVA
ncbi:MAG: FAD binding domain-containing protein, partial [Rectinemataceae bacterium]